MLSFPHSPDVCDYRGPPGDEVSLVVIVLSGNVWEPWWVTGDQSLETRRCTIP